MNKIIAISFLFVFLSANTELGQLLRLPVLVHHFLEHKEIDETETLVNFIKVHYEKNINHPDDKHGDHQKLPFKSIEHSSSVLAIVLPITKVVISEFTPNEFADNKIYSIEENYSFSELKNIWQPPRLG